MLARRFITRSTPLFVRPRYRYSTEAAKEDSASQENKEPSELEKLQESLKKKDLEIAELKDLYRRALAETENVRTRTQKELKDKEDYAVQKFAKDLLTTADILSMALDAVPEKERGENATHPDLKNLYIGVHMTRKELLKTFEKYGVVGYNPMGQEFDFNLHTAIFQSPMPNLKAGTVFHVDKIGYKIKDRVLRPANVGVVKDPEN
jgi:molecular chaperone GrpE